MSAYLDDLPALDCHAHVNPTVTAPQIATLGGAHIFAMTRTLAESRVALRRSDSTISWGIGAHPGRADALADWNPADFERQLQDGYLVGEVGLDRRGPAELQTRVFRAVLERTSQSAALVSVHSVGRHREVLDLLDEIRQKGVILHWFTGSPALARRAVQLGCFFSINAAMTDEQIRAIPTDRILPETDFPSSKARTGATKPGDVARLEQRIGAICRVGNDRVRAAWYRNLGNLAEQAMVVDRLPTRVREAISAGRERCGSTN